MDIEILRNLRFDVVQELDKFLIAVPRQTFPNHTSIKDIQSSEKCSCPIAPVIMALALGNAALKRQNRSSTFERLNLRLLVDAEDQRLASSIRV
jgi:hypothetical protein